MSTTVTTPQLITIGEAGRPGPSSGWEPRLGESAPGLAFSLQLDDRVRIVVLETPESTRLPRSVRRDARRRCWHRNQDVVALDLLGESGHGRIATSVALVDLWPDGQLKLTMRDAPPALLLSRERPTQMLGGPAGSEAVTTQAGPDDLLLICSATYLESPPPLLGTVRRAIPDRRVLADLRHLFAKDPAAGATASLRRRPDRGPSIAR